MFQKENPDMMEFLGRVRSRNLAELTRFIFEIFTWLARLLERSPVLTSPLSRTSPDYAPSLTKRIYTLSLFGW